MEVAGINFIKLGTKKEIPYPVGRDMPKTIEIVQEMCDKLMTLYEENMSIQLVVRGSSGAIIGGLVASILNGRNIVTITHIKKKGESSHSSGIYDLKDTFPIVIIDDLISSGSTVNEIYKALVERGYYDVDTLCVSRDVELRILNFKPKNIITGAIYEK